MSSQKYTKEEVDKILTDRIKRLEDTRKKDLDEKDWDEFDSEHSWIVGYNQALDSCIKILKDIE